MTPHQGGVMALHFAQRHHRDKLFVRLLSSSHDQETCGSDVKTMNYSRPMFFAHTSDFGEQCQQPVH